MTSVLKLNQKSQDTSAPSKRHQECHFCRQWPWRGVRIGDKKKTEEIRQTKHSMSEEVTICMLSSYNRHKYIRIQFWRKDDNAQKACSKISRIFLVFTELNSFELQVLHEVVLVKHSRSTLQTELNCHQ